MACNSSTVMPSLKQTLFCIAFLITLCGQSAAVQNEEWVRDAYRRGDFKLAERTRVADIVVAAEDFKVVQIAAANLTGAHNLKIYMVDAGVVLDKIVIDTGGLKPSYLGPPETRIVARTSASRN